MRHRFVLALAFFALVAAAPEAGAASKLCLKVPPKAPWPVGAAAAIDVPENPRFVIESRKLDGDFDVDVGRADLGGNTVTRKGSFSIEAIDDDYSLIKVHAADGDWIVDPGFEGDSYCSKAHRVFRVVRGTKTIRHKPILVVARDGGDLELGLRARAGEPLSWTRLDHARRKDDLVRDLHGTRGFDPGDWTYWDDWREHSTAVRLVRFFPDGKRLETYYAVGPRTRAGRVRSAPAPRTARRAALACRPRRAPRPVPLDAEVVAHAHDRLVATTLDGSRLPVRVRFEDLDKRMHVDAAPKTVFLLRPLPLDGRCADEQPLLATDVRSNDLPPRVLGLALEDRPEERGWRVHNQAVIRIGDAHTWGLLEVAWAPAPGATSSRVLADASRVELFARWQHAPPDETSDDPPSQTIPWVPEEWPEVHLTITPLWPRGLRGTPWRGVMRVDPKTRAINLTPAHN